MCESRKPTTFEAVEPVELQAIEGGYDVAFDRNAGTALVQRLSQITDRLSTNFGVTVPKYPG